MFVTTDFHSSHQSVVSRFNPLICASDEVLVGSWPTESTSLILCTAGSRKQRVLKFIRKWMESGVVWREYTVVNLYVSLFSNYKFDHVNIKIEKKMNGVWFGFSLIWAELTSQNCKFKSNCTRLHSVFFQINMVIFAVRHIDWQLGIEIKPHQTPFTFFWIWNTLNLQFSAVLTRDRFEKEVDFSLFCWSNNNWEFKSAQTRLHSFSCKF